MKKVLALTMAGVLGCTLLAACGGPEKTTGEEKVVVPVGTWVRKDENPTGYENAMKTKAEFEELNPGIEIQPVEWSYALDTFLPKAAAGELPIVYEAHFTEVRRIAESGYAQDVSKFLDKYGYTEKVKEEVWDLLTYDNMRAFLPSSTYIESLHINKNLFTQAGLVNEDGSVKIPQTYEELIEYAGIIKEKTGKAGFAIPTTGNQGGWAFMNIAWSYGVEFMKKGEDGNWIATFDSPECVEAMNILKRARFEYDAVPPNVLLNPSELGKLFATDQLAMYIIPPPQDSLTKTYDMDPNNLVVAKIPAGTKSRTALLGGGLTAFSAGYTDEQYDAAFKWKEFNGSGPTFNSESSIEKIENGYKNSVERGNIVGIPQYTFWKDDVERIKIDNELREKYSVIDAQNYADFMDTSDITIKPEEPVNCQQLYEVLDTCIQKVYESPDSDVEKIMKDGCEFFQKNYLDRSN